MDLFEQLSSLFTPASENSPALLDGDCKQSVLGQYICCETTVILLRYHWLLLVTNFFFSIWMKSPMYIFCKKFLVAMI